MATDERLALLSTLTLDYGAHDTFDKGHCALELVAWLAGEKHGDHPECCCPVLGAFVRTWNDDLNNKDRNRLLRPILPRLINTKSTPAVEEKRSYLALDWLIRVYTPEWLALRDDLKEHATTLRGLSPVIDMQSARAACDPVRAARAAARAAGDAARAAAWDAAWDAAGAAAWAAASDAAGAAAWDAAGDAAMAAAMAAASAAWVAARAAAGDAAWAALKPTTARLQASAVELLETMMAVDEVTI